MAAKTTTATFRSTNANDLAFRSQDGAINNVKKLAEHVLGGLNGAHGLTSVVIRDNAVQASATLTLASVAADTVILINGVPFSALSGTATAGNDEFDISGSDTADAAALAAAINASTTVGIVGVVTATSNAAIVTLTAAQAGRVGNGLTVENLGVVASGTVTYSGSSGVQTVLINGVTVYNATGATDAANATAAAAALNASANALVATFIRAVARAGVTKIFSKYGGTIGNAITLTATGTGATASGSGFLAAGTSTQYEGAQASGTVTCASASVSDTVTVNGVVFTAVAGAPAANQFDQSGTDTADATSLAAAINISTSAGVADVVATSSGAVVTFKSRRGGLVGNAITLSSSNAGRLLTSGARLTGGAVPTVAVVAGGSLTPLGSGARLASGTNDTAITNTL